MQINYVNILPINFYNLFNRLYQDKFKAFVYSNFATY